MCGSRQPGELLGRTGVAEYWRIVDSYRMGIQPENIFLIRAAASQIVCATRATGLEGRLIEMNGTSWRHAHQRLNPLSQEYSLWEKMTLAFDRIAHSTSAPLISDFHAVAFASMYRSRLPPALDEPLIASVGFLHRQILSLEAVPFTGGGSITLWGDHPPRSVSEGGHLGNPSFTRRSHVSCGECDGTAESHAVASSAAHRSTSAACRGGDSPRVRDTAARGRNPPPPEGGT